MIGEVLCVILPTTMECAIQNQEFDFLKRMQIGLDYPETSLDSKEFHGPSRPPQEVVPREKRLDSICPYLINFVLCMWDPFDRFSLFGQ